jgi:hypothetical protein
VKCEDAQELITGLVDNELLDWERSSIESHLKECRQCQWSYQQERSLKKAIQVVGTSVNVPTELRRKILSDRHGLPGTGDASRPRRRWSWPIATLPRPAIALVLLLIVALPTYYLTRPTKLDISAVVLETHEKIRRGDIVIARTGSEEELKKYLSNSVGGSFSPMKYDLAKVNMKAIGGVLKETGGRKILVTVYQGNSIFVTCYTLLGTEKDAPADATVLVDSVTEMNFYTFSQGTLNAVFHREGNIICILVSELPTLDLLAAAKMGARKS